MPSRAAEAQSAVLQKTARHESLKFAKQAIQTAGSYIKSGMDAKDALDRAVRSLEAMMDD